MSPGEIGGRFEGVSWETVGDFAALAINKKSKQGLIISSLPGIAGALPMAAFGPWA